MNYISRLFSPTKDRLYRPFVVVVDFFHAFKIINESQDSYRDKWLHNSEFKDKTQNSMKPVSWNKLLTPQISGDLHPTMLQTLLYATPGWFSNSLCGRPASAQLHTKTEGSTSSRITLEVSVGKARPHDFLACFSHPTTHTPPCLTWAKHMCLCSSLRETIFPLNNAEKKINLSALLCALKEGQQRQPSSFHTAPFSNKICLSNKPGKTRCN